MNTKIQVIDNDSIKAIDGGKFAIVDANNRKFEVTLDDIVDCSKYGVSDISSISDSVREKMLNFSPNFVDSEGVNITDSDLLSAVKNGQAEALDVTFEATHSGENLNHAVYTSASLERDTQTWMFPFGKPLIKNHYMDEEPIGRTIDAMFGASEIVQDKDCINVTYRVSDADAMTKFADGRYKTMSIGARSGYIRCNTCGKDILKDGKVKFCGHWKGDTYAGKKATWTVENMTFREGSVVNAPADVYAQVKQIKIVNGKKDGKMSNPRDNTDNNILDAMNGILDGQDPAPAPTPAPQQDPTPTNDDNKGGEGKSELEKAQDKITELEDKVTTLTADNEKLTNDLKSANDSLTVVNADNEANKADVEKYKDQSLKMAQFNLKLMKDNAKDLNPDLSDAELENKSAKEINDMIGTLRKAPRTTSRVPNPGAPVINDNTDVGDGGDASKKEEPKRALKMRDADILSGCWDRH